MNITLPSSYTQIITWGRVQLKRGTDVGDQVRSKQSQSPSCQLTNKTVDSWLALVDGSIKILHSPPTYHTDNHGSWKTQGTPQQSTAVVSPAGYPFYPSNHPCWRRRMIFQNFLRVFSVKFQGIQHVWKSPRKSMLPLARLTCLKAKDLESGWTSFLFAVILILCQGLLTLMRSKLNWIDKHFECLLAT